MSALTIFSCDPWEGYLSQLEQECEDARLAREHELDVERARELEPTAEAADVEYIDLALATDLNLVTNDLESDDTPEGDPSTDTGRAVLWLDPTLLRALRSDVMAWYGESPLD